MYARLPEVALSGTTGYDFTVVGPVGSLFGAAVRLGEVTICLQPVFVKDSLPEP